MHNKERIFKTAREKRQVTYNGRSIRITSDFLIETQKARRVWTNVLRNYRYQARFLFPVKLIIMINRQRKCFIMRQTEVIYAF